jgi:hypothetical protein
VINEEGLGGPRILSGHAMLTSVMNNSYLLDQQGHETHIIE